MKNILRFLHHRETGCSRLPKNEKFFKEFLEELASNPTQNQACELTGQSRATFLMDFSPDGTKIASTHGDHTVRVTDIATGKCTHILTGHPRTPWTLAFHPSFNGILASGCLGGEVRIWDLHGGGSEVIHSRSNKVISSLAFHPTDHVLVFATGGVIYFWDWRSRPMPFVLCKTAHEYEKVRWLRFDPLGHYLYTGIANDSTIQADGSASVSYISDSAGRSNLASGGNSHYQRIVNRYRVLRQNRTQEHSHESRPNEDERPYSPVHEEGLRNARQYAFGITNISRAQDYASRVTRQNTEQETEQNRQNIFPTTGALRAQHSPDNSNMYSLWGTLPSRRSLCDDSEKSSQKDKNYLSDDIAPGPSAHVNRRSLLHRTSHSASFFPRDYEINPDPIQNVLRRIRSHPRQNPTVVIVGRPVSSTASLENSPAVHVETRQFRNSLWSVIPPDSTNRDSSEPSTSAMNLNPLFSSNRARTPVSEINNNVTTQNSNLSRTGVESFSVHSTFSDQSLSNDTFRTPARSTYCDGYASGANNSLQNLALQSERTGANQSDLHPPISNISAMVTDHQRDDLSFVSQNGRSNSDTFQSVGHPRQSFFSTDLTSGNSLLFPSRGVPNNNSRQTDSHAEDPQLASLRQRADSLIFEAVNSRRQSNHNPDQTLNMRYQCTQINQPGGNSLSSGSASECPVLTDNSEVVPDTQARNTEGISPVRQSYVNTDQSFNANSHNSNTNQPMQVSSANSSNILLQSLANLSRNGTSTSSSASTASASPFQIRDTSRTSSLHAARSLSEEHPPRSLASSLLSRNSARRDRRMGLQLTSDSQENLPEPREDFLTITARLEQEVQELQTRLTNLRQSFQERVRRIRESHDGIGLPSDVNRLSQGTDLSRSADEVSTSDSSTSSATSLPMIVITESRENDAAASRDPAVVPVDAHRANQSHERPPPLLETALRHVNRNILPTSTQQSEVRVLNPPHFDPGQEQRNWHSMQRHHLHPHYAVSILDETINRPNDAIQTAINRAIAGAFMGTGETAVANNIINQSYRIQRWDFQHCDIPDISDSTSNIVVPHCKLHNDASCDISQDGSLLSTFVPSHRGFPDDNILGVFSLRPESLGQCLFTKSFGPNAISTSISPNDNFLMVGLASKKLTWVFTPQQMVGQIFKLAKEGSGENSMKHIADILHPCDIDNRTHISINSARWLPGYGDGIVYGTNKGHLHICRPGNKNRTTDEAGVTAVPSELSDQLPLFHVGYRASSSTQTHDMWRSLGTQTESRENTETRENLPDTDHT